MTLLPYPRNDIRTLERIIGNREAIGAQLLDLNGNAIDLTGKTVVFRMVNVDTGTVKINDAAATVVTAASGIVQYSPTSGDVDTAGRYAIYFKDDSSPVRRWPYDGARWQLVVKAETEP